MAIKLYTSPVVTCIGLARACRLYLSVQLENKIIVCIYLNVQIHDTPAVKFFRCERFRSSFVYRIN